MPNQSWDDLCQPFADALILDLELCPLGGLVPSLILKGPSLFSSADTPPQSPWSCMLTTNSTVTDEIILDYRRNRRGDVWYVFVPDCVAGHRYAFRVDGPIDVEQGHLFDFHQPLLDRMLRPPLPIWRSKIPSKVSIDTRGMLAQNRS